MSNTEGLTTLDSFKGLKNNENNANSDNPVSNGTGDNNNGTNANNVDIIKKMTTIFDNIIAQRNQAMKRIKEVSQTINDSVGEIQTIIAQKDEAVANIQTLQEAKIVQEKQLAVLTESLQKNGDTNKSTIAAAEAKIVELESELTLANKNIDDTNIMLKESLANLTNQENSIKLEDKDERALSENIETLKKLLSNPPAEGGGHKKPKRKTKSKHNTKRKSKQNRKKTTKYRSSKY
jgi:chromosome segregation ATPase